MAGGYLVSLEYWIQAAEAAFRKELVYVEDGEPGRGMLHVLFALFAGIREAAYAYFSHMCACRRQRCPIFAVVATPDASSLIWQALL